ncbi:PepSY-associated TM helix domain-containing protein [Pseudoteredinibacter isoporae]|uniref:Putative iron-regulated membrane protein n=1 Tax=Pseudoteredinibacter isoporae TaxID=570281 RepID=A0A7X0JVU1_9GAMM|nr:PepSY-associated TM helix domain-containing protein [Pseudoteredinibacter isoporae]MBB6522653.1 putative iron-regulated membrane protein [Pseudoteredinibacter isoporae]NHO88183.1 PepSY domain-containing protein [Pseudoteredinibacter isoporae]NIB23486.1 PepSY domain-containing protein [Pseudoteredinibacter isoporae]
MSAKSHRLNRKIHFWGAILCVLPVLIMIGSGVLLLLKKESDWIQPPTIKGQKGAPTLSYEDILAKAQAEPRLEVDSWGDIKRLDVRPDKGVIKLQARNGYEMQLDQQSGEVLHLDFRRSDVIEAIHDGSFFHGNAKLGLFLPASLVLLALSITGIYLFTITLMARARKRRRINQR